MVEHYECQLTKTKEDVAILPYSITGIEMPLHSWILVSIQYIFMNVYETIYLLNDQLFVDMRVAGKVSINCLF